MEGLRREDVEVAAREALGGHEGLALVDYSVRPAGAEPVGFMGTHLRVAARVRREGSLITVVRLFAKAPPPSPSHCAYVALCRFFSRECRMLATYGPRLSAALGPRPSPLPRCLLARGEDRTDDVIVLEDLSSRGFEMADKRRSMGLPECRAVLGALARLHGASALLQRSDRGLHAELEAIEEPIFFYDMTHPSCLWNRSSAETFATAAASLWPRMIARQKALDAAWASWMDVFQAVRKSDKYLNVLCHGDTWANNIMLRYPATEDRGAGEQPEVPGDPEVVLVDFQLHRFAPPVLDILFFLHSATRRALRDEHLESLLRHYREVFSHVVTPEVADNILPWEHLVQSAHELRVFGRYFSGTALMAVVLPSGGNVDEREEGDFVESMMRDRGRELVARMEADPVLRDRLTEAYVEYLQSVGLWEETLAGL